METTDEPELFPPINAYYSLLTTLNHSGHYLINSDNSYLRHSLSLRLAYLVPVLMQSLFIFTLAALISRLKEGHAHV